MMAIEHPSDGIIYRCKLQLAKQLVNTNLFISLIAASVIAAALLIAPPGYALDAETKGATTVSMHEVARQIRQYKTWQILDAASKQKASGNRYFRFKLLSSEGKVKIINIDPKNPNLRRLEQ